MHERTHAVGCPADGGQVHRARGGEALVVRDRITQWADVAKQAQQRGQGLVEYGLLLVFIAVVATATVAALGTTVVSLFSRSVFSF